MLTQVHHPSTTVDQDAPSPITSHTTQETQTPKILMMLEEDNMILKLQHMWGGNYRFLKVPEHLQKPILKYALESLKKNMAKNLGPVDTPMVEKSPNWMRNKEGKL
ncbi:hypothetical protein Tco_0377364 [Tanacetum coccineum]